MLEKYLIYLVKYPLKNKIKFYVILQILELKKNNNNNTSNNDNNNLGKSDYGYFNLTHSTILGSYGGSNCHHY